MKDLIERLLSKASECHVSESPLYLEAADAINKLYAQLPEGMKHCTILFKECIHGHGRLTATNWVQHDCVWCRMQEMEHYADALEEQVDMYSKEWSKLRFHAGD